MATWIWFDDVPRPTAAVHLAELVDRVAPAMRRTEGRTGGLNRDALLVVVDEALEGHGHWTRPEPGTFAHKEVDRTSPDLGLALSVQAGRAYPNNGALLAVLAAAALRDVDWLVLTVPALYKNAKQFEPVAAQLQALSREPGVRLSLKGVVLLPY